MNKEKFYRDLEREFEATFIPELIPGILHNFANPLNGIMGRARLLQKKAKDAMLVLVSGNGDQHERGDAFEKIARDIDLIAQESDRLYGIFNDVAVKLQRLHNTTVQSINLSELIETEVAFCDFYLDFKHRIEKELVLNRDIPSVTGIPADYSIALSAIIRHTMNSMRESTIRKLTITTCHDSDYIFATFSDTGIHGEGEGEALMAYDDRHSDKESYEKLNGQRELFNALSLLKKYGARFAIENHDSLNTTTVMIPCRI